MYMYLGQDMNVAIHHFHILYVVSGFVDIFPDDELLFLLGY